MSLQPGDVIDGKYRIVRLLGEGGMGAVYEGENARIRRKVAIKVLHAAVAAKADVVQRFEREATAAGHIGSEHIVEVIDLGNLPSGERFMVMEYLEGESLGDRIKRRKRLGPHEMAHVVHQLLEGLAAAHAAGIIHRDIKPDNVYLLANKAGQRDFVKLLDFGVSKFNALDADMSMTKTGAVMGTPFYMAPEQARGGKVDIRSDLYSVGVVVYQAVTGRVPFHAETFNELVFKIALESPEPAELVAPGLDPAFAALIARAMVRDPGGRFQSAKEFQAAVGQWMMTAPPQDGAFDVGRASFPVFAPSSPTNPGLGLGAAGVSTNPGLGPGGVPLGQSGGALVQSGVNPFVQSGAQLSASQTGLAMTSPQPKKSGMVIALSLAGMLAVAAGGFFAYRTLVAKTPPAPAAATTATVTTTVAEAPVTVATAVETAPPPSAVAAVAETAPTTAGVQAPPRLGAPWPKSKTASSATAAAGKATATATAAAAAPPPVKTGRTIGTDL